MLKAIGYAVVGFLAVVGLAAVTLLGAAYFELGSAYNFPVQ